MLASEVFGSGHQSPPDASTAPTGRDDHIGYAHVRRILVQYILAKLAREERDYARAIVRHEDPRSAALNARQQTLDVTDR
jgi:hypothetical protein